MKYNKEIHKPTLILQGFEEYLKTVLKSPRGPFKYRRMAERFTDWAEEKGYKAIRYTEMMAYIRYCKSLEMNPKIINRYLKSVRHLFDYLISESNEYLSSKKGYNPAKNIQIKGVFHTIKADNLNEKELEELIENYKGKQQILLGLLVYQGLKMGEIEKLEKIHFDLKKGNVYIPKTLKGNSRTLKLEAWQIYDLMEHIIHSKSESLLGYPLTNQGTKLCKALRKINPKVQSPGQLRYSRISYWVRTYDIREAQYLAGHNCIAGTEKYRNVNIEDLQNQVNKYHPLQ